MLPNGKEKDRLMLNSLDLPGRPEDTRVVVAMSGGVDSSVTAALLKHQGYDVIGVTMQLYDHGKAMHRVGACCAGTDIQDARRVAEHLGIPHYVLDYESRFKEAVIDRFAESYLAGETPVPCVTCNQTVKFEDLLEAAKEFGADCMATGHYISSKMVGNRRVLFRPSDEDRDQTYFLFATTQEQIDFLRFPLGGMSKPEARQLAHELGLVVADKKDSQDICFVPTGKYTDIIERLHPGAAEPGKIVHIDGTVLGDHKGIIHYTVGQRRGLGVSYGGGPLYVVKLDPEQKHVLVGPREALVTRRLKLRDVNWLGPQTFAEFPESGLEIYAKVRSTRPPKEALLYALPNGEFEVELLDGEEGVAPGQACVFYEGLAKEAQLWGGGWIDRTVTELAIPETIGVSAAE